MIDQNGEHRGTWPYEVLVDALFMIGPSQGTLLALWLALGGGKLLWRVVPTALGVVVYYWSWPQNVLDIWLVVVFGLFCFWGVVLLIARVTGLELERNNAFRSDSRRSQFYIRDMLAWMTALAVVLSTMRCLPKIWAIGCFVSGSHLFLLVSGTGGRCLDYLCPGRKMAVRAGHAYAAGSRCGHVCVFDECGRLLRMGLCPEPRLHGRVASRVALAGPAGRLSAHVAVAIQPR